MENKIFIKKETMKGIADAIRAKDGTTEEIAVTDMAERIGAISGIDYLDYCDRFAIWSLNLFGTPIVELTLPRATNLNGAFRVDVIASDTEGRTNITVEELIIHCPNIITNMGASFGQNNYYADYVLKKIVLDFETKAQNWSYAFQNARALKYIEGTPINLSFINGDTRTISMFERCDSLKEVRFQGILSYALNLGDSKDLSKASILNLSSCLSADVSEKALTLNKEAVDKAFETSSGAADGSTSTEWAELIATKPNWTISLA